MGATVSTLASYVVFCALRYWASNLFFKVHYEWGRVFTTLAVGSAVICGFYLIDSLRGDSPGELRIAVSLAIKATLALSFPLLLLALRFFNERELHRVAEIWQKLTATLRSRRRLTEVKPTSKKLPDTIEPTIKAETSSYQEGSPRGL